MRPKPLKNDFTDADLEVGKPATWAVGLPAIEHAMIPSELEMGTERTVKIALTINHKRGFDCPSCAWANPDKSKPLEFCENGIKSIVWESTPLTIPASFWAEKLSVEHAGQVRVLARDARPNRRADVQAGGVRSLRTRRLGPRVRGSRGASSSLGLSR